MADELPRVLVVAARFPPYVGGIETHVLETTRHLARRGVPLEVLTTDPGRTLPVLERFEEVTVRRVAAYPRGRDWHFAPGVLLATSSRRFDVIHVQGIHTLVAPMAMLGATIGRTPFVVTFHTGGHRSSLRRRLRGVQWYLLGPLLRRAASLVAVSQFERALIARAGRIDPARIRVIRNGGGLPISAAAEVAEDPDLVLSVGRLERYKGHHRVIAAMPELLRLRPGASLTVLGDGPERAVLAQQAESLGVADRVTIRSVPARDRGEMARVMASAGLVVLLSEYEAHPVAVTEARALGRRVLVADTTGLSEVAAAGEASAVPLGATSGELATAIDQALGAPPPSSAGQPSWADCADQLLDLYRSVHERRRPGRRATRLPRTS